MRSQRRSVLRAQGRMVRNGVALRSWHPTIVGPEANPSFPGFIGKHLGKSWRRRKLEARR